MSTTATAWEPAIAQQIQALDPGSDVTHAVVYIPASGDPQLVDVRESEASAVVSAEDKSTKYLDGELRIAPIGEILRHAPEGETADAAAAVAATSPVDEEPDPSEQEREQLDAAAAGSIADDQVEQTRQSATADRELADLERANADKGQLFEQPKVAIDMAQPTLINLAFSGGMNVTDRDDPRWTKLYNDLKAGKTRDITVTVYAAGASKRHRRDKEGDVDAIVETKSLIVTDVHLDEASSDS